MSGVQLVACIASKTCWAFVIDKISFLTYGFYPIEARWRVNVFFVLLATGIAWMAWLNALLAKFGVGRWCAWGRLSGFVSAVIAPPVSTSNQGPRLFYAPMPARSVSTAFSNSRSRTSR